MSETSGRLLRLLSLLQTPREWPGPELATRLDVTERTVRKDVARLRDLGYPVDATRGATGGYRLASGQAMPPLLLDDDEAVAVAVALRTASSSGVAGLDESALRAVTKLQQVLPVRLRGQVEALGSAVDQERRPGRTDVDAGMLSALAMAVAGREIVRFGYVARDGAASERRVEPYRLVTLGRRWYLVGFDVHRADWRTFRLDRVDDGVRPVGHRFTARPLPADDMAAWVAERTRQVMRRASGRVRVFAPATEVERRLGHWVEETLEVEAPDRCVIRFGGPNVGAAAFWLGSLDIDFEVLDPVELRDAVAALGRRYARAAGVGTGSTV